jgi:hypothetical protein
MQIGNFITCVLLFLPKYKKLQLSAGNKIVEFT